MNFSKEYKELAKIIVGKFRDENFKVYKEYQTYCLQTSNEEFRKNSNPNKAQEFLENESERFELYNSLNPDQLKVLDKLILNTLDHTAFNVLREIEEKLETNEGIGLTVNGKRIEEFNNEFLSGTCFGEYFKWIEDESEFGNFQH